MYRSRPYTKTQFPKVFNLKTEEIIPQKSPFDLYIKMDTLLEEDEEDFQRHYSELNPSDHWKHFHNIHYIFSVEVLYEFQYNSLVFAHNVI